jgi:hypothetical protein
MLMFLFFTFVAASSFIALTDWRKGLFLLIVAGLLQDPIRKMIPGAPGYMVLSFVPIWLAICAAVLFSSRQAWARFLLAQPQVANAIRWVGFSLALALVVLLLNYGFGALPVGIIGLIGYLFPILAIAVGYYFVRRPGDLIRFMKFYSILTALMLAGGVIEYWDLFPGWPAVGTDVLGTIWFRQYPGHIVYMISGFFRSPDLMGWHAALLVMFSILMSFRARNPMEKLAWLILTVWGATNLLISGRNKMIFMPAVFIAVVGILNLYKGSAGRVIQVGMVALISVGLVLAVNSQLDLDNEFLLYTQRGATDATERVAVGGLGSVWVTYRQSGFFGEGLGSASTGARYGGSRGIRTWQESGPSKLMVELGVIGFISVILFAAALFQSFWRQLRRTPANLPELQLYIGLLGITAANAASFVVSHQAFGDPFLVTLTGLLLGISLSAGRWIAVPDATGRAR